MKKALIIAYAKKNLGDDLFIYILANRYKNTKFYLCARTKYSQECFNLSNLKLVNPLIVKEINKISYNLNMPKINCNNIISKSCDAMILIGGSMFMENADIETCKKRLSDRFLHIKNEYYILGSNFGPYISEEYRNIHKDIFKNAKDVCFREEYSYNLFKDLKNVRYASDIVFSMDTSGVKIIEDRKVVISIIDLSIREGLDKYKEVYENKMRRIIEYFLSNGYKVTLMSFCSFEGDEEAINSILNLVEGKDKVEVYRYDGNIQEALNVIASCKIVIAARFHAMILGLLYGKTVIPLIYSRKTLNVINDIGFKGKYLKFEELSNFDINEFTEQDLNYKFDITNQIEDSKKQFEVLDICLKDNKSRFI
ncbi:MAG: polysaccharide pyruvyl transferase family protein [Clostridia bacterium]|nr:polysaccharide pyruvyl transferase family protein [Clostridia bacterium]MDD4386478.1 polysaccharide pyruvyl transferase family protein [Clostridia bacterium]